VRLICNTIAKHEKPENQQHALGLEHQGVAFDTAATGEHTREGQEKVFQCGFTAEYAEIAEEIFIDS